MTDSNHIEHGSQPAAKAYDYAVANVIDAFVSRVRDIEDCERFFVPVAIAQKTQDRHAIKAELEQMVSSIEPSDRPATGATIRAVVDVARRLERIARSQRAQTLRTSLFLGIFSAYDTFTGDLIGALFSLRPELFQRIGRDVPVADVLTAPSLEQLKAKIVGDWVEDLRRKSYIEQFEALEKMFDVKLRAFPDWSTFVEVSQRRNLFAHCDGVVSQQYISICRREGSNVTAEVGSKLSLREDYFARACTIIAEVGLKLGHTLWRKIAPADLAIADKHLHHLAYEALQFSEWGWAKTIGDFGLSQKRFSTEQNRLVFVVNQAIALKRAGNASAAQSLLDREDWSAASTEFKLAAAVLRDEHDRAGELMVRLGPKGDLLDDSSYHDWPLFRDFRGTPQFLAAYEKVYGRPFTVELSSSVSLPTREEDVDSEASA